MKKAGGVMVAVLCGGERSGWIHPSLNATMGQETAALSREGRYVEFQTICGWQPHSAAREELARRFLASPADWLACHDADTVPVDHYALVKMINKAEEDFPAKLVCICPYVLGHPSLPFSVGTYSHTEPDGTEITGRPTMLQPGWHDEWTDVSFGCSIVHRLAFAKLQPPYYRLLEWTLRRGAPGEDTSFCQRLRAAGVKLWSANDYLAQHYHTVDLLQIRSELNRRNTP
jgi:GT2 family glycosyltransferase